MQRDDFFLQLGQRISLGLPGLELDDKFVETIKRYKIGNAILFSRNLSDHDQIRELTSRIDELIKSETEKKPFIMIDEEGGIMSRLPEEMRIAPTAMSLGFLNDKDLAYRSGFCTATLLKSLGINYNLAPSLDVNTCKDNPVIGVRSISSDSKVVADIGLSVFKGQRDGGVYSSVKHFPGHGNTSTDSHYGLPKIDLEIEELEKHLYPFKKAVDENIDSIMTTHIIFPYLDDSQTPATLSRKIINGYLRKELGYNGVVLSDCMEMGAIKKFYTSEVGVFKALNASLDIALISHTAEVAVSTSEYIYNRYKENEFDMDEMALSLSRIEALKNREEVTAESAMFDTYKEDVLTKQLDAISIQSGSLPPYSEKSAFIGVKDFGQSNIGSFDEGHPLFADLAKTLSGKGFSISASPSVDEVNKILEKTKECKYVYFGTYNAHVFPTQKKLLDKLVARGNAIVITLCNPYDLSDEVTEKALCTICAWDYSKRVLEVLSSAIKGERSLNNKRFEF